MPGIAWTTDRDRHVIISGGDFAHIGDLPLYLKIRNVALESSSNDKWLVVVIWLKGEEITTSEQRRNLIRTRHSK